MRRIRHTLVVILALLTVTLTVPVSVAQDTKTDTKNNVKKDSKKTTKKTDKKKTKVKKDTSKSDQKAKEAEAKRAAEEKKREEEKKKREAERKAEEKRIKEERKKALQRKQNQSKKLEEEQKSREKQRVNKIKDENRELVKVIQSLRKELVSVKKLIGQIEDQLIKSLKEEQITELKNKKYDLLIQKIGTEEKLKEAMLLYNSQKEKEKKLKREMNEKNKWVLAEGTLNWRKIFDINNLAKYQPGKWSLHVKAEDDMGNVSDVESINIKIDPQSDIPTLNVINPVQMGRVPGNLRVVGTANDDDAVDKIVILVDNEKEKRIAEGKDFWYYDLDTSEMVDGLHRLNLRVYDIKGVVSKMYTVDFHLDRKTPIVSIETMTSGEVVSGKIAIGGRATDYNGIKSCEYSVDNRETFVKIQSKYLRKDKSLASWNVKVDTRNLVDGVQTIWIKSTDFTGSEGFSPLTITVDHKAPVVDFQYPKDKDKVDGKFIAYGYARDNVDIKKVTMAIKGSGADGKPIEIAMLPGNQYWSFPVDLSKMNSGRYVLEATTEDVSGNITSNSISVELDTELDKPVIGVKSFKKEDRFSSSIQLFGPVKDDDGMKAVEVSITKAGAKKPVVTEVIENPYSFSTDIPIIGNDQLSDGKYTVVCTPVDINGTKGKPFTDELWIDSTYPGFNTKVIDKWAGDSFKEGKLSLPLQVNKDGEMKSISFSLVSAEDGKVLIKDRDVKFKKDKEGTGYTADNITVDLNRDKIKFTNGIHLVNIKATDKAGKSAAISVPVILDAKLPTIKMLKIDSKKGMMKDGVITIDDDLLLKNVSVDITSSDKSFKPIAGKKIAIGKELEKILNVKGKDGKFLDYTVTVTAVDLAGNTRKESVKLTFKETKQKQHKVVIKVESKDQTVYLDKATAFIPGDTLGLDVTDSQFYGFIPDTSTDSLAVAYGDVTKVGEYLKNSKQTPFFTFRFTRAERVAMAVGSIKAELTGSRGEQKPYKIADFTMYNDTEDPSARILWPPMYTAFNDNITVYGAASDDSGSVTVQYSEDGKTYTDITTESVKGSTKYSVPYIDPLKREKNQKLDEYLSESNQVLVDQEKLFRFEVPVSTMKDGEHTLFVKIRDAAGKEITKKVALVVDKKAPEVKIWTPKDEETVNGEITIRGEAKDETVFSNVVFLHNNNEQVADGANYWDGLYNLNEINDLDLQSTENIPYEITMFGIDSAGNKTFISKKININVKSDAPAVYINSPSVPNQRFSDNIELGGIALDDDGIEYVQYRIDYSLEESVLDADKDLDTSRKNWKRLEIEKGVNWKDTLPKDYLSPGKHILEVQAIDIYGLKSEIVSIPFHLDKENPDIRILTPVNGTYLEGEKIISGRAQDPNDIELIEISTNYGWTFVPTEGKESWKHYFDSRSVPDGPLRVLVRGKDQAGSESFTFALYNIDNTDPEIDILLPKDNMMINNKFRIVGRANDNIGIDWVKIFIDVDEKNTLYGADEDGFVEVDGDSKEAWYYELDTTKWDPRRKYHLIARVKDLAGNIAEKSLDFRVNPVSDLPRVELDQPQPGQHMTGETIDFFGTAFDDDNLEAVYIKIDDGEQIKVDGTKTWKFSLPTVNLEPGVHKVIVVAQEKTEDGKPGKFSGPISRLFYLDEAGPVVNVESHINGAPMEHRPWLMGKAEYYEKDIELKLKKQIQQKKLKQLEKKFRRTPELIPAVADIPVKVGEVKSLLRKYRKENEISDIYLSLDNGKTYEKHKGSPEKWKTRVQTQYLLDGPHMLQIKAVTKNKKSTIRYFRILIDRHVPEVIIDTPRENFPLNERVVMRGSADDNGKIDNIQVMLRRWDKNLGKVPKGLQGLYLWAQADLDFLGGSGPIPFVNGGLGLSFFEDIVRVEMMFGWKATATNLEAMGIDTTNNPEQFSANLYPLSTYSPRFSGVAAGGKLVARILDIPWEFFFGEDARQFSMALSLGAAFYWFSGWGFMGELPSEKNPTTGVTVFGKPIGMFLLQWDIFRIERLAIFRKFAIYAEVDFYFVASEVQGGLLPVFGFGLRNALF
jgi:hypothetical protein